MAGVQQGIGFRGARIKEKPVCDGHWAHATVQFSHLSTRHRFSHRPVFRPHSYRNHLGQRHLAF
jgi:hypothetical protein